MSDRYQAYPGYKDSEIEWLSRIPEHWFSTKIKYGYNITLGKMLQKEAKSSEDKLKTYLKAANIQPNGLFTDKVGKMWFSLKDLKSLRLCNGDVLITEGGDVGRVAIWRDELAECYIQNAINRARPLNNNSSRYLYYWMNMLKDSNFIDIICNKATIAHYTAEKVEVSPLFLPPDEDAISIANFLDHETAKIDTLIEKQQQLIKLLKEKRQAVISHAVTKGLNPDAPMRDSGVEWLGEVPEEWKSSSIKNLCYVNDGNHGEEYPAEKDFVSSKDGIPFIRAGDFDEFKIIENDLKYISYEKNSSMRKGNLQKNDILFVNRGATIGKLCLIDEKYVGSNLNSQIAYLRANNKLINYRYLIYFLSSIYIQTKILAAIQGGALPQYPIKHILNIDVWHPNLHEQSMIASFLDDHVAKVIRLIEQAEKAISLLKERRTALISAAVTGKIDVRSWQSPEQNQTNKEDVV